MPTAADNVFFDAASGSGTVATSGTIVDNCLNLNFTGFTGTFNHAAATTVNVYGSLTMAATGNYTRGNAQTSDFDFEATSGSHTVTCAGRVLGECLFRGVGGTWTFQDDFATSGALSHTAGTLDTNSKAVSALYWTSNGTTARTLTLGSSQIAISSTSGWTMSGSITITANTATVTLAGNNVFNGSGLDFNGLSVTFASVAATATIGACTVGNLSVANTGVRVARLNLSGDVVVTGTIAATSNDILNRLLIASSVGTRRTLSAAVVTASHTDWQDITAAGAASWDLSGAEGGSGDASGNTGITFTPSVTRHKVAGTGLWSSTIMWSDVQGGASGATVPLPQDDVVFGAGADGTITMDMPRACRDLNLANLIGTLTIPNVSPAIHGDVILGAAGAISAGFTGVALICAGRGEHTITTAGRDFAWGLSVDAGDGIYTFADPFLSSRTGSPSITLLSGTLDTNGQPVVLTGVTGVVTLSGGTLISDSEWTLQAAGTFWNVSGLPLLVMAGSTLIVGAGTATRTFLGGTQAYDTIRYTVADSPGILAFSGAMSVSRLEVGPGRGITQNAAMTIGETVVVGEDRDYIFVPSSAAVPVGTPDHADFDFAGDFEIVVKVRAKDWTVPVWGETLVGKWGNSTSAKSWALKINVTGQLALWVGNGTALGAATSSVVIPATDDVTTIWLKATWRQSDRRAQFFTATDAGTNEEPTEWTQLGTDVVTSAAVTAIVNTTTPVWLGLAGGNSEPFAGRIYRVIIRAGGTIRGDFDVSQKPAGADTYVDSAPNPKTWTISSAVAVGDGRISWASATPGSAQRVLDPRTQVTDSLGSVFTQSGIAGLSPTAMFISSGMYGDLSTPDTPALSVPSSIELIAHAALDDWTPTGTQAFVGKGNMYFLAVTTGGVLSMFVGSSIVSSTVAPIVADGEAMWVRATWDDATNVATFYTGTDGVTWTQLGATRSVVSAGIPDNALAVFVGAILSGGSRMQGRLHAVKVLSGIGGTPVLDFDFGLPGHPTHGGLDYVTFKDIVFGGMADWYAGSHSVDKGNVKNVQFADVPVLSRMVGILVGGVIVEKPVYFLKGGVLTPVPA